MKTVSMFRYLAAFAVAMTMSAAALAADEAATKAAAKPAAKKDAKMSLAAARAQIAAAIANPAQMTALVKALAPADQIAFVKEVNAAVNEMPGSPAEKAATALTVNRAALAGAAGNIAGVTGAVFASAAIEALPTISSELGKAEFNRATDSASTLTDAQYTEVAQKLMTAVGDATKGSDNAAVRNAFAVKMMETGANGSPATIGSDLAKTFGAETENLYAESAKEQSVEPLLAAAGADAAPEAAEVNEVQVIIYANEQMIPTLMNIDQGSGMGNQSALSLLTAFSENAYTDQALHTFNDPLTLSRMAKTDGAGAQTQPVTPGIEDAPWNPDSEPRGYPGQTMGLY